MACVTYNVIKEGFVSNASLATQILSDTQLSSLYIDGAGSSAITISIGNQISVQIEYNDVYDVCYLDYHTDEVLATNISIKYQGNSEERYSSFTLVSAGKYRATINDFAKVITITHTSPVSTVKLNKIEVIVEKNETIGFGEPIEELSVVEVSHATKGTLSAATTVIPVFNTNNTEQQVSVAIAPTLTKEDQYLFLATNETGPYYGINGHGFQQPAADGMKLVSDNFMGDTFPEQWSKVSNYKQGEFTPTEEGLIISSSTHDVNEPDGNLAHRGIITKDFFTPQSFTAEIDIKFLAIEGDTVDFIQLDKAFFFALTNSVFIDDVIAVSHSQSDDRVGFSIGALSILRVDNINPHVTVDNYGPSFAHLDGKDEDSFYLLNEVDHRRDWSDRTFSKGNRSSVAYGSSADGDSFSEINNVLNEGKPFGDFSTAALWHTWRMVYDHTSQELSVYSNNLLLGSAVYKAEAFKEGCKLWIGGWHQNGYKVQLRNFNIRYDKLYKRKNVALTLNGGVATATLSGIPSNVDLLNDGLPSTFYIGPHPDANTKIKITFDKEYDIVEYKLQQRGTDINSNLSRFGVGAWRTDLAIAAEANYGDKYSYLNKYKGFPSSGDIERSRRSPTYLNGPTVASGVGFLELSFVDYDEGGFVDNALIIDSLDVYAEVWQDITVFPSTNDTDKFKWTAGRWRNLKQSGPSLVMQDPRHNEVAFYPITEYIIHKADYGYSSSAINLGFSASESYDYTEALFSFVGTSTTDTWQSAPQSAPEVFTLWKYFTEEVEVSVIFTYSLNTVAREFKFQYLREGSDPNDETSWLDIPPMSVPHNPDVTADNIDAELRYGQYKQYKIDNNDGEFYTNNSTMPDALTTAPGGIGTFIIGERSLSNFVTYVLEDKIPAYYPSTRGLSMYNGSGYALGQSIVVELDSPIETRGIRVVVKNPVSLQGSTIASSSFDINGFKVWSASTHASYTSPVFGTGTVSNTERVIAEIDKVHNTSTKVFIRSSDVKPTFKYDTSYEVWSSEGNIGTKDLELIDFGNSNSGVSNRTRAVSVGNLTYLIGSNAPYVYNHTTSEWLYLNGGYPGQGSGEAPTTFDTGDLGSLSATEIVPSDGVQERAGIIDNVIYVAASVKSNTDALRIISLNLNTEEPKWTTASNTRPLATKNATMCAIGNRLYFFAETGPIFHWDVYTHIWEFIDAVVPLTATQYGRTRLSSILYKGKVYLFGDQTTGDLQSSHEVSIFNPDTETFTSGEPSPKAMRTVQPFIVGDIIYLLSSEDRGSDHRYYPLEDRWEVFSSLRHTRSISTSPASRKFYYYHNGYVYLYVSSLVMQLHKALLTKPEWEHGEYPDIREETWGLKASQEKLKWLPLSSDSEFMPQSRYLQFKVEFASHDKVSSPVLNKIKVVTPQQLTVTASGTANLYLKVSGTTKSNYRLWYTARGRKSSFYNDHTLLHTVSETPDSWTQPTVSSGIVAVSSLNPSRITVPSSPWVLPSSTVSGTYDVWYSLLHNTSISITDNEAQWKESDVYYINTSTPENLSQDNLAVSVLQGVSPVTYAVLHPCVVELNSTTFKMWYTTFDAVGTSGDNVKLVTGRINYAESVDKVTWTSQQSVILSAQDNVHQYDAYSVYRPCVIYNEGTYRMWYTAQDGADGAGTDRIVYRESTDGVSWSTLQLHIDVGSHGNYDIAGCSNPHVFLDINTYYMFYIGTDGNVPVVIRAESPDGFDWFNFKVVMSGYGIDGALDSDGIADFFVMVEREEAAVGDVLTSAKLKLHNDGTGI